MTHEYHEGEWEISPIWLQGFAPFYRRRVWSGRSPDTWAWEYAETLTIKDFLGVFDREIQSLVRR